MAVGTKFLALIKFHSASRLTYYDEANQHDLHKKIKKIMEDEKFSGGAIHQKCTHAPDWSEHQIWAQHQLIWWSLMHYLIQTLEGVVYWAHLANMASGICATLLRKVTSIIHESGQKVLFFSLIKLLVTKHNVCRCMCINSLGLSTFQSCVIIIFLTKQQPLFLILIWSTQWKVAEHVLLLWTGVVRIRCSIFVTGKQYGIGYY